jgi:carbamoyl-phosphate synthase large subunit
LAKKEFKIIATDGTSRFLNNNNVQSSHINKVHEGKPHIVDLIRKGLIDLIINTTEGKQSIEESLSIRAEAVIRNVTYYTSLEAVIATMDSFDYFNIMNVTKIQDYYKVKVHR